MRNLVLLFIFIFSPLAFSASGSYGKTEIGKTKVLGNSEPIPKTVKEEIPCDSLSIAIKTLSEWQTASGSYYDPKDTSQTKVNCDGKGSFERMIQSGSIALGSSFTKFFVEKKDEMEVLIETNLNVVTPFGKGIFRLDDSMKKKKGFLKDNYYLDFHEENLTRRLKDIGRFKVNFRIYKILEI
jgi:hypothetical protein